MIKNQHKRIVIKSRNKQHGRPRRSQVSYEQYADNWDKIFKDKNEKTN